MADDASSTKVGNGSERRYHRFTSLDGLRGLAAVVVVIHHSSLISPALARSAANQPGTGSGWSWWLSYTPLHFLWAGTEAVYVFFVLSGFVLTLPFTSTQRPTWRGYYPRRLVRLYLPVWGGVLFAALTFLAVSHHSRPSLSWWLNLHDVSINAHGLIKDLVLVAGANEYNTPLWSLRWEVLFSLLLPAYIFVGVWVRRRLWPVALVFLLAAVSIGSQGGQDALIYMPMFGLGVLLAVKRVELTAWATRLPRTAWAAVTLLSVLFLLADWMPVHIPGATVVAVCGAMGLVFLFLGQRTAISVANASLVQWLGKRSFSLYLVHEPIVVSAAFALSTTNSWLILGITLPLSLAAAEGFYALVERPCHQAAGAVGRRFEDRREPVLRAGSKEDLATD